MLACVALAGCAATDDVGEALRLWMGAAAKTATLAGVVFDSETGQPVADAEVEVSGQRVPTHVDGTFETVVPTGRMRVTVRRAGYVSNTRETAVGELSYPVPFRVARKGPRQLVGKLGGLLWHDEAALEAPAGAYSDGASVTLTYVGRPRVGAVPAPAQFIDVNGIPRRVMGAAAVEASETPSAQVKLRVPVPQDATPPSVRAARVNEDGAMESPIAPETVADGIATFGIVGDGIYVVTVDVRDADGQRLGYVVEEPGDAVLDGGQVLTGSTQVSASTRTLVLVDPRGTRVEIPAQSRIRVEPPTQEGGGVPGGDAGAIGRLPTAVYAGQVAVEDGTARLVVAPPPAGAEPAYRVGVNTRLASLLAKGTAFTVRTCGSPGQIVETLEVVEGVVDVAFGPRAVGIDSGQTATLCERCPASPIPMCPGSSDGGGSVDSAIAHPPEPGAADAAVTDAPGTDAGDGGVDAPPTVDGVPPVSDVPVVPTPDAMIITPDGPVTTPDASVTLDMRPDVSPDAAELDIAPTPDATVVVDTVVMKAVLDVSPSAHDFMTTTVGSASSAATFRVSNTGNGTTGGLSASLEGAQSISFQIVQNGCAGLLLAPGGSCDVLARFAPSTVGQQAAGLRVGDGTVSVLANVSGTGAGAPGFAISPTAHAFPLTIVGVATAPVLFTVSNPGGSSTGTPNAALIGGDVTSFAITSNGCMAAIPAGGSCAIYVRFNPASSGAKSASLQMTAAPGGTLLASLSGTGQNPASLTISPATLDWGSELVGQMGKTVGFSVTNNGTGPTGGLRLAFGGTNPADFGIPAGGDGCTGVVLQPGDRCSVDVYFLPQAAGTRSADLAATEPFGAASKAAALSGTGIAPAQLSIKPMTNDYGAVMLGDSSAGITYAVSNVGGVTTGQVSVGLFGTNPGEFKILSSRCGGTLAPGASCDVVAAFAPTSIGAKMANLQASAAPGGAASAALLGRGTGAQLSIKPTGHDFGQIKTGQMSPPVPFTVTNVGDAQSGSILVGITSFTKDFVIAGNNCRLWLEPNGSCQIDVIFRPVVGGPTGAKTGALNASATPGGTVVAQLRGIAN